MLHVSSSLILSSPQTQALAERQSAVYSLQRKLKACRQALESKELHLGLLQKKVARTGGNACRLAVTGRQIGRPPQRRLDCQLSSPEAANLDKAVLCVVLQAKRMERQLKQVHERVVQQRESICHLKAENLEMQRLQVNSRGYCIPDFCGRPGRLCRM